MKAVAILAVVAVLVVALAPGIGLHAATLRSVGAAVHVVRSLAGTLRPRTPSLNLLLVNLHRLDARADARVSSTSSLLELDCTWLC